MIFKGILVWLFSFMLVLIVCSKNNAGNKVLRHIKANALPRPVRTIGDAENSVYDDGLETQTPDRAKIKRNNILWLRRNSQSDADGQRDVPVNDQRQSYYITNNCDANTDTTNAVVNNSCQIFCNCSSTIDQTSSASLDQQKSILENEMKGKASNEFTEEASTDINNIKNHWNISETRIADRDLHGCTEKDRAENSPWCAPTTISRYGLRGVMSRRGTKYKFMGRQVPVTLRWLCSERLSENLMPLCRCDMECVLFGDCCVDAFETFLQRKDEQALMNIFEDPETLHFETDPYSFDACYLHLYHNYSSCYDLNINNSDTRIKMVDECPENYSTSLNPIIPQKCRNLSACTLSSIPVSLIFSKQWQVVFRNIYCALCHGLDKEDVVLWNAYANCPEGLKLKNAEHAGAKVLKVCTGVYHPPVKTGNLRRNCIKDQELKSECDVRLNKTHKDRLACSVYIAPVNLNGVRYKNIHCAYCDKRSAAKYDKLEPISEIEFTRAPTVYPAIPSGAPTTPAGLLPEYNTLAPAGGSVINQPSLKVLFDFSFLSGFSFNIDGTSKHIGSNPCPESSFYDYISNRCKPVFCPYGREWIDGICKNKEIKLIADSSLFPKSATEEEILVLSILTQSYKYQNINGTRLLQGYINKLKEVISTYIEDMKDKNSETDFKTLDIFPFHEKIFQIIGNANVTFFAELHMRLSDRIEFYELIKCVARFRRLISKGHVNRLLEIQDVSLSNRKNEETYACSDENHLRQLLHVSFDVINNTVYLINGRINVGYHALFTRFSLGFLPDSSRPVVQDVIICSFLQCPQTKLSDEEYHFVNDTLQLNRSGKQLPPSQYEIRNGTVFVCIPPAMKRNKREFYKHLHSAQIIQKVTSILSLTALGLTILIYIKSASLRTLHGKTLVSLSISLIGAQLTGLLENVGVDALCRIIAIIMHFSWLSSFGWMSVISYDMLRKFLGRQTSVANTHSDRKRYLAYSLVGWLLPGAIIISCITLDYVNITEVWQPGYAKANICNIVGDRVRLIFFQIPFLCSVVFNTVAFVLTVYSISTKKKSSLHSKRSKERLYSIIYLKMSVAMGITWLFAILASITNQPAFWYLHLVLNGLQGVFVFIAFALRTSVWKNIKIKKPNLANFHCKTSTLYTITDNSTVK